MRLYTASSPKVEVNGETIYSIVDGMGVFKNKALKILAENGIENPLPGQWYSQQDWLNSFKTISENVGDLTLFNIGIKIPENANFPSEIENVHKALSSIDVAFQMNHKGGSIGYYKYHKTGEDSAVIVCDNPYPDEFDKGIITAMCRKFANNTTKIKVQIDKTKETRANGGDSTTYIISW